LIVLIKECIVHSSFLLLFTYAALKETTRELILINEDVRLTKHYS